MSTRPNRRIPDSWFRASGLDTTMDFVVGEHRTAQGRPLSSGERRLGWFILPAFQRPAVWTLEQRVRFIESCWMGLPIGVFIWNDAPGTRFDRWLLDGQQRVGAVLAYMADEFPVFGFRFSELTEVDYRIWGMTTSFPCRKTTLRDEALLRDVYDRLAYGGTPHEPKFVEAKTEFIQIMSPRCDVMIQVSPAVESIKAGTALAIDSGGRLSIAHAGQHIVGKMIEDWDGRRVVAFDTTNGRVANTVEALHGR